jgi:predicted ATP-binding protein involved in virulence
MDIFISEILIKKVRHLVDVNIPLSKEEKKHLILTGINGIGKTSVLEAMKRFFTHRDEFIEIVPRGFALEAVVDNFYGFEEDTGVAISFTNAEATPELFEQYKKGELILAYFPDDRRFNASVLGKASVVKTDAYYRADDPKPREIFIQYLINLYIHQLKAVNDKDEKKANEYSEWFGHLQKIIRLLFDDESIKLSCNLDTYDIDILRHGYEPFTFNTLSSGYSAAFDIISNLIIRMINKNKMTHDVEGIVLIDEPEAHLHIALQKKIMRILVSLFPRIQYIVATHSPFIINSLDNAVVFDLQKRIPLADMSAYSYEGIVEGYFEMDQYSIEVQEKLKRYEGLIVKPSLTTDEIREMQDLETYLLSAPDYLSKELTLMVQDLMLKRKGGAFV